MGLLLKFVSSRLIEPSQYYGTYEPATVIVVSSRCSLVSPSTESQSPMRLNPMAGRRGASHPGRTILTCRRHR